MTYKTFLEQRALHVQVLREHGLDVSDLVINTPKWVRCREINSQGGRGDLAYVSTTQRLSNGLTGLSTSYRGIDGPGSYKTYGYGPDASEVSLIIESSAEALDNEASKKRAYGFWINSNAMGESPYLKAKGVGCHDIRFRDTTAVIPLRDVRGVLLSYQLVNADGSKLFMKDGSTKGLFHWLKRPQLGEPFGLAEGYSTAATVFELTEMPIAACMSAQNLVDVVRDLLPFFPATLIFIFTDNDRHLLNNVGLTKAGEARALAQELIHVVAPSFDNIPPSKDASDWNDLMRLRGREFTRDQIRKKISEVHG